MLKIWFFFYTCFNRSVLRVAFFQAKTLFELLQQASNRKPEPPNRARKATTTPRRAFANEKTRDEIIKEICAKSHPKREPTSPEESIESKGQPQPENRLPEAPQRPQEVSRRPQEAPRKHQEAPNYISLSLPIPRNVPSCFQTVPMRLAWLFRSSFRAAWDTCFPSICLKHKTSNTSSRHSLSTNSRSGSAHGRRP